MLHYLGELTLAWGGVIWGIMSIVDSKISYGRLVAILTGTKINLGIPDERPNSFLDFRLV